MVYILDFVDVSEVFPSKQTLKGSVFFTTNKYLDVDWYVNKKETDEN